MTRNARRTPDARVPSRAVGRDGLPPPRRPAGRRFVVSLAGAGGDDRLHLRAEERLHDPRVGGGAGRQDGRQPLGGRLPGGGGHAPHLLRQVDRRLRLPRHEDHRLQDPPRLRPPDRRRLPPRQPPPGLLLQRHQRRQPGVRRVVAAGSPGRAHRVQPPLAYPVSNAAFAVPQEVGRAAPRAVHPIRPGRRRLAGHLPRAARHHQPMGGPRLRDDVRRAVRPGLARATGRV